MRTVPWQTTASRWLLILAAPVFLVVAWTLLFAWPMDVARGLASAFSGHDVVQVASGLDTGVTLLLVVLAVYGLCWAVGLRPAEALAFQLAVGGCVLCVPVAVLLGWGAEYALGTVLDARGYAYCTFHTTDTGKGGDGTYVYLRKGVPEACPAVRAMFPPGKLVADRRDAFDLPVP